MENSIIYLRPGENIFGIPQTFTQIFIFQNFTRNSEKIIQNLKSDGKSN